MNLIKRVLDMTLRRSFCEHGDESLDSIKGGNFFTDSSKRHLLKNKPWNQLITQRVRRRASWHSTHEFSYAGRLVGRRAGRNSVSQSVRRITLRSKVKWTSLQKGSDRNELGTIHISHAVFLEFLTVDNWMEYIIEKLKSVMCLWSHSCCTCVILREL